MNFDGLISALKQDEGCRLKPYKCPADKWTIGYGRNIEDNGISSGEAHDMLVHDAIKAQKDAADLVPNWLLLDDVRQNVIANMAFNMGKGRLSGFKKMLAAVEAKDFETAANEMTGSAWYSQVGARAKRLVEEMRTGIVS